MDGYLARVLLSVAISVEDRLCGLMVRVPGYRYRGPGSIAGATRFSEKYSFWNGVHLALQLRAYLEQKVAAPV
jgi:hypothetical protein